MNSMIWNELCPRMVKYFAPNHTGSKWQSQNVNQRKVTAEPFLTTVLKCLIKLVNTGTWPSYGDLWSASWRKYLMRLKSDLWVGISWKQKRGQRERRMRVPGRRKILCKGPEVEKCMAHSRSCEWARVSGKPKGSRGWLWEGFWGEQNPGKAG